MNESPAMRSTSPDDGRMEIEGSAARYVQGSARRFRLKADGLRFVGGFESRDGRLEDGQRILAVALVADGVLRRAGHDGEAGAIGLALRPLPAVSEQPRLLLMLGYREDDGVEAPFAEAFLAPAVFEALKADMREGLAQEVSLDATTNLWTREEDRASPQTGPLGWYLAPGTDGRAVVPARGFIDSIEWHPHMPPEPGKAPEAATPPPPVASHEGEPAEDWREEGLEQLSKLNWSFKLLLLLFAFLLLIIAAK